MSPRVHSLANGVRVICDPMPGLESAALSVVIRGGARWESQARSGWSHLLEHMVFKGAGGRSARQIVEAIEADGGQINAATGYERTSFQLRCLKGRLGLAMEVAADLVRHPTLDAVDLEREVAVVGQEIAEAADTPDDRVFDLAQSTAFPGQALGRPILGSESSIGAATPPALGSFHSALYGADRLVVSAAGAVDEDELLKLVDQCFGTAEAPLEAADPPDPGVFSGGLHVEARSLEQAHLVAMFPGVGVRDPDYFAMRLFAEILGGGMSSRLFQEAREERGLAYAIDAYAEHYEDVGVLGVYAGTGAGDAAQTAALVVEQLRALADAPSEQELARAKAQAKAHLFMGRESTVNRAEQSAGQLILFDRVYDPSELAAAIDAVSVDDLRRVGERTLASGQAVLTILGPKRAGGAAEAFQKAL